MILILIYMKYQVFALFNDIAYSVGAYFIYLDWKTGPTSAMPAGNADFPPA